MFALIDETSPTTAGIRLEHCNAAAGSAREIISHPRWRNVPGFESDHIDLADQKVEIERVIISLFDLSIGSDRSRTTGTETLRDPIAELCSAAYRFAEKDNNRAGAAYIFNTINDWLCRGRFDLCDRALTEVRLDRLNVDLTLSFLVITYAAKNRLTKRAEYFDNAWAKIRKDRGRRIAKKLLANLA